MAGLAAADALHAAGLETTVIEAAPDVGGLARAIRVNGEPIEAFYHHIFPQDHETIALASRLGMADRIEWLHGSMAVLHQGRVFPFDSPLDLLRFTPLSLPARLRLGVGTVSAIVARDLRSMDDQASGTHGPRRFGRAGYDLLWRPMLEAKFGQDAGSVPLAWLASRIRQRAAARRVTGDRLGYFWGSLGTLSTAYAEDLRRQGARIETGTRVGRLHRDGHRWVADVEGPGGPSRHEGDVVVAALSGQILARITELPRDYLETVSAIDYRGVVCVLLELTRPLSKHYWVNVTDRLGLGCVGVIEHTNLVPPDRYGGRHLVYLAHYVSREDPAWGARVDELIDAVEPAFRALNGDYRRDWVVDAHVSREPFAQPVPQVGGPMPSLSSHPGLPGLGHASLAHVYPADRGVSLALRLGRATAAQALASVGQRTSVAAPHALAGTERP